MSEQLKSCPGCGLMAMQSKFKDEPPGDIECCDCTFRADAEDWNRRTPDPATKAMLEWAQETLSWMASKGIPPGMFAKFQAFIDEWPDQS